MDDVLVHGKTEQEHDQNSTSVLGRIQSAGVTLNKEGCLFGKKQIKFLGQIIDENGIASDPDKEQ